MSEKMKKVELLAPAGSFEALQAAVQNGCDAVYLGGSMFGARAFANNFDEEEMKKAIRYAHTYGVKVFVTVNTLIKEDEIEDCVRYVRFLYEHDADALIVQDLGLFSILRERFPDIELHASTQMHIHNPQGITFMKQEGACRVVVPRETPIEEIRAYTKLGVDIEVFVQGALCVSYSGQCLMSSLTLGRSGNRGECAQNCRMQYQLEKSENGKKEVLSGKGAYLLSPQDMNTLDHVPELIEAGIASFKIEGRMKRPEYVAVMVALYRQAIDAYYEGTSFIVDEEKLTEMKKVFNRGFTQGHLFHAYGPSLMNPLRPNHMGIAIGKVIRIRKQRMVIELCADLMQGDGIRILKDKEDEGFRVNRIYQNDLLVHEAKAGDIIELDKSGYVEVGARLVKTSDTKQLKQLQESYAKLYRRIPVYAHITMKRKQPLHLEVMDEEGHVVKVNSTQCSDIALSSPLRQERIEKQLRKTKDTPYDMVDIQYDLDEEAIHPIADLNQLRRDALAQLTSLREVRHLKRRIQDFHQPSLRVTQTKPAALCAIVHTKQQAQVCAEEGLSYIFMENKQEYPSVKQSGIFERTPRVMKDTYEGDALRMIQETGGLCVPHTLCDTSLNLTNSYTAAFLLAQDAIGACFSLESDLTDCIAIQENFQKRYGTSPALYYPIYGHEELMLSEYCPINAVVHNGTKRNCGLCRGTASYALLDLKKQRYPLLCDEACRMHLLSSQPRNRIHEIKQAQAHGIGYFLVSFTIETPSQCRRILRSCKEQGITV